MRLSEMYYTIRDALDHWIEPTFQEERQKNGAPLLYICNNMRRIFNLLTPIKWLPEVEQCLYELEKVSPAMVNGKLHYLNSNDCNKILTPLATLHLKLDAMRSMCETLGMNSDSDGFDVKLPPNITLSDAAQCIADLDMVFSQCPIFPNDNQIRFSGVDIGSTWLTFVVVGATIAATLRAVAELADKVIILRSHQLSYKQEQEHLRSIELSNDILESLVSAHKAALDKMTATAVQELSAEYGVTENEDRERLRMSLDRLGKWIDRGMEIHASIGAPKETKLLFPSIERQSLPQEIIKALGEANKDE